MTAPTRDEPVSPALPTPGQRLVAFCARAFVRVVGSTLRVEELHRERLEAARATSGGRVLFAFWHGRQFPLVYRWRGHRIAILTSMSRDGALQSRVLGGLGFTIVRGSSSRGAVRGLVGMIRSLEAGNSGAFAVDGPRGPVAIVKPGVLAAARKSGLMIVPITSASARQFRFRKAWDDYRLPFPFTRTLIGYGDGIGVAADADESEIERLAGELGTRLSELTRECDDSVGG